MPGTFSIFNKYHWIIICYSEKLEVGIIIPLVGGEIEARRSWVKGWSHLLDSGRPKGSKGPYLHCQGVNGIGWWWGLGRGALSTPQSSAYAHHHSESLRRNPPLTFLVDMILSLRHKEQQSPLVQCLPRARHSFKCFTYINSSISTQPWGRHCYYPHVTDREAEAQRA